MQVRLTPAQKRGYHNRMGHFRDYLTKPELKTLAKRSDVMGAWLVLQCWGVIIACMAVFAIWPNPLTFIAGVIIVGSRQLGMAILQHEAAHRTLFNSGRLNDFVGQYLLAWPFGGDMRSYRPYHMTHHRFTQQDNDPDLVLSAPFPVTKVSMKRKLLRDLTGQTALKIRVGQFKMVRSGKTAPREMLGPVLAQAVIFAVCAAFGVWWAYFAMYLLPLLTWFQAVLRIRNIAEHAMVSRDDNPLMSARTTYANLIERALVAPYWVNYHVEHHAYIYIPCYNLPKAHAMLLEKGFGPDMNIEPHYSAVMRLATSG